MPNKPQLSMARAFYSELPYSFLSSRPGDIESFVECCIHSTPIGKSDADYNALLRFIAMMFETSFPLDASTLWSTPTTLDSASKLHLSLLSSRLRICH